MILARALNPAILWLAFEQIINRHFTIENKLCIRNLMVCANGFWDARVNVICYKNPLNKNYAVRSWVAASSCAFHSLFLSLSKFSRFHSIAHKKTALSKWKFTIWHRPNENAYRFYDNDTNAIRIHIAKANKNRIERLNRNAACYIWRKMLFDSIDFTIKANRWLRVHRREE